MTTRDKGSCSSAALGMAAPSLRERGQHHNDCRTNIFPACDEDHACTCGLSAALATPSPAACQGDCVIRTQTCRESCLGYPLSPAATSLQDETKALIARIMKVYRSMGTVRSVLARGLMGKDERDQDRMLGDWQSELSMVLDALSGSLAALVSQEASPLPTCGNPFCADFPPLRRCRLCRFRQAIESLRLAAPEFCSARCPSVFTSAEQPRHVAECDAMRALVSQEAEPPKAQEQR